MSNKAIQEKYVDLNMLEQQIRLTNQQVEDVVSKIAELEYIKTSLDMFGKIKPGTEVLAPISSGVFIKTKLSSNSELLVNVGAGTVVKKDIAGTKKLMDEQIIELESLREQLLSQLTRLSQRAQDIESELSKMAQGMQG